MDWMIISEIYILQKDAYSRWIDWKAWLNSGKRLHDEFFFFCAMKKDCTGYIENI